MNNDKQQQQQQQHQQATAAAATAAAAAAAAAEASGVKLIAKLTAKLIAIIISSRRFGIAAEYHGGAVSWGLGEGAPAAGAG